MKVEEREKAIKLRSQGMSIPKIANQLGVSRGSVSVWVREVELTPEQKKKLRDNSLGNNKYIREYAQKRKCDHEKIREGYRQEGFKLAQSDDSFRMICALYWGDGHKAKNTFAVSNCDCRMINVVGKWLVKNGYKDKIGFTVLCPDATTKNDSVLADWWKDNLEFLEDSMIKKFTRYEINRASQWKRKDKQPNGTARVYVCNTRLVQMVFGGIDYLSQKGA
jgi:predicted transcriptional regulator